METQKSIPVVSPSDFDDYLFSNWKAPVYNLYEKFHIERIENYKPHLKLPTPPHRRSVFFMIILTKGSAIRSKGLSKYELTKNCGFCLPANQITNLDYMSNDAEGYYFHFLPEIFNHPNLRVEIDKDFSQFSILQEPFFELSVTEKVIELLHLLQNEYRNDRFNELPFYLFCLLSEIKNQSSFQGNFKNNFAAQLTQEYKNALNEFIYTKKTVSEFAEHLSVSPNHLNKSVKATTGKSAHQLLDEMRILEAKVLLRQTNLSIGEIAFKIGKFDPSDFSRFFKNNTKITPNQYRNSII